MAFKARANDFLQVFLADEFVYFVFQRVLLGFSRSKAQVLRNRFVEYNLTDRGFHSADNLFTVRVHNASYHDFVLQADFLGLVRHNRFFGRRIGNGVFGNAVQLAVFVFAPVGVVLMPYLSADKRKVIRTHNHILRGAHNGLAVGQFQYVVGREH